MYRNPCGGCGTLGAYGTLGQTPDNGTAPWWQAPVTQIVGAVSTRISGPDSGYPPGSYEWDYDRLAYRDPTYAPAPRGISLAAGLGLAAVGLLGLKLTGVI